MVSDSKPQWLNNESIQLMRRRDKAYKVAHDSKKDSGLEEGNSHEKQSGINN